MPLFGPHTVYVKVPTSKEVNVRSIPKISSALITHSQVPYLEYPFRVPEHPYTKYTVSSADLTLTVNKQYVI
jgi:hypothetical protein